LLVQGASSFDAPFFLVSSIESQTLVAGP
jgi:hypothetical protein